MSPWRPSHVSNRPISSCAGFGWGFAPRCQAAVEEGQLVRYANGIPSPAIPPDPVILFEGFEPGSPALAEALESLPILDPASMFLATYRISAIHRQAWIESGSGLVIGTPPAIDGALSELTRPVRPDREPASVDGSDTILLDRIARTDLELCLCGLALPTREGQKNIRWCSGSRAARARTEQFTLDRVLAGRQQVAVKPLRGSIEVVPLHQECATFILREGRLGRVKRPVRVRVGDMIVTGTTVVSLRAP